MCSRTLRSEYCSVTSLPQYTVYFALAITIASQPSEDSLIVPCLSAVHTRLSVGLRSGHPTTCKLLLRFLASLALVGAVSPADVLQQLHYALDAGDAAVDAASTSAHARKTELLREATFFVRLVLSTLPYFVDHQDVAAARGITSSTLANDLIVRCGCILDVVSSLTGRTQDSSRCCASTVPRQCDFDQSLDVPQAAGTTMLETASKDDTEKLFAWLHAALTAADGAPSGWLSSMVPRPQDIPGLRSHVDASDKAVQVGFDAISQTSWTAASDDPGLDTSSRFYVRSGLQLFGECGLSAAPTVLKALQLDSSSCLDLWILRDVAHDIIVLYHPFHVDCSNALLSIPHGTTRPQRSERRAFTATPAARDISIAVEAAITQQLWLPRAPLRTPFYTLVLINLLASDSASELPTEHASSTFGIAAKVLWKYVGSLDDSLLLPLASWIAHHVSNAKWSWMWEDWSKSMDVSVPAHSAQKRFFSQLLQATFALLGPWHYERVVGQCFSPDIVSARILPADVTKAARAPCLRTANASDAEAAAVSFSLVPKRVDAADERLQIFAEEVTGHLKGKLSSDDMQRMFEDRKDITMEEKLLVFATLMFYHGRANYKNAQTLLERYQGLLRQPLREERSAYSCQAEADPDLLRSHILLSCIHVVWRDALHNIFPLINLLIDMQFVPLPHVVKFCCSPAVLLTSDGSDASQAQVERVVSIHHWSLLSHVISRAADVAARDATEVALFRGAKVYDAKEEELEERAATQKEDELLAVAERSASSYTLATQEAVRCLASSACMLAVKRSTDASEVVTEALRLALSHLRAVCRRNAACVQRSPDFLPGLAHLVPSTAENVRAVLLTATAYTPKFLVLPSALLRDRDVPRPDASLEYSKIAPI
jgi:hypothetical protein